MRFFAPLVNLEQRSVAKAAFCTSLCEFALPLRLSQAQEIRSRPTVNIKHLSNYRTIFPLCANSLVIASYFPHTKSRHLSPFANFLSAEVVSSENSWPAITQKVRSISVFAPHPGRGKKEEEGYN